MRKASKKPLVRARITRLTASFTQAIEGAAIGCVHRFTRAPARKVVALAIVAAFGLFGCSQENSNVGTGTEAGDTLPVTTEGGQLLQAPTEQDPITNQAPAIAASLVQQLQASAFATADPALKESYAAALIAYQVGDYSRALEALTNLGSTEYLTTEQSQAAEDLIEKSRKAAGAELPGSNKGLEDGNPVER